MWIEIFDKAMSAIRKTPVPDRLYHYTSGKGLLGILESGSVWFTHIRYCNDPNEFQHGLAIVEDVLSEMESHDRYKEIVGLLRADQKRQLDGVRDTDIGLFCLTQEKDLLSQWRGYCTFGNGYCIGVDPGSLTEDYNFFLEQCIYDDEEKRKLVMTFVEIMLGLKEQRKVHDYFQWTWFVKFLAVVFKNRSFSEEREWRLVFFSSKEADWEFRDSKTLMIPFHSRSIDLSTALKEIVIGPSQYADSLEHSLRLALGKHSLPECQVVRSSVPFRDV